MMSEIISKISVNFIGHPFSAFIDLIDKVFGIGTMVPFWGRFYMNTLWVIKAIIKTIHVPRVQSWTYNTLIIYLPMPLFFL